MANPVWIGLEKLDRVAEQVKAGTWVQPTLVFVADELDTLTVEQSKLIHDSPPLFDFKEIDLAIFETMTQRVKQRPIVLGPMRRQKTDYETLLQGLEELKL